MASRCYDKDGLVLMWVEGWLELSVFLGEAVAGQRYPPTQRQTGGQI